MKAMTPPPRLVLTMGDVAGVGPEVLARAWPDLLGLCRPVVVGDPRWLERALGLAGVRAQVMPVGTPGEAEPAPHLVPCLVASGQDLGGVAPGRVSAAAGRA